MAEAQEPLMQIGEIADRSGLSLRTLRHYDDIDLLAPSARSRGGFRLYTEKDLERLMIIRRMKPLGYSLEDMHRVMKLLRTDEPGNKQEWAQILKEAATRRADLTRKVAMADEFLDLLSDKSPLPIDPAG